MPEIVENMFFFPGHSNVNLLGFTHIPDLHTRETGILYCHPFAEEKNSSHFITANAARAFAGIGYPVMRFDLCGCGDSEGDLKDVNLESWLEDIEASISIFKERAQVAHVILWGLRLGSALALLASHLTDVKGLLLWQPVLNLDVYITQFLRNQVGANIANSKDGISVKSLVEKLEAGETVEVFGYRLSSRMYQSFIDVGKLPTTPLLENSTFIASISQMSAAPAALTRYVENAGAQSSQVAFEHIEEEPFWDRYERWEAPQVVDKTAAWLKKIKLN